jgi:hypothetical protein
MPGSSGALSKGTRGNVLSKRTTSRIFRKDLFHDDCFPEMTKMYCGDIFFIEATRGSMKTDVYLL